MRMTANALSAKWVCLGVLLGQEGPEKVEETVVEVSVFVSRNALF